MSAIYYGDQTRARERPAWNGGPEHIETAKIQALFSSDLFFLRRGRQGTTSHTRRGERERGNNAPTRVGGLNVRLLRAADPSQKRSEWRDHKLGPAARHGPHHHNILRKRIKVKRRRKIKIESEYYIDYIASIGVDDPHRHLELCHTLQVTVSQTRIRLDLLMMSG